MISKKMLILHGYIVLLLVMAPTTINGYYIPQGSFNQPTFTTVLSTDKASYTSGEPITISGNVEPYDEKRELQITILDPTKRIVMIKKVSVASDGTFSITLTDTSKFEKKGTYSIRAQYGTKDVEVGTASFMFDPTGTSTLQTEQTSLESKVNIPNWIRNNARWWSQGSISDNDFLQGIQYMIKNNILKIPDLPEQASEKAEERVPEWIKNNAGWWADGQIDDISFIQGIQFLVLKGIIIVEMGLKISSTAFSNNGFIPSEYTCDGEDTSPELTISNVPKMTKSIALIMDDPDAPMKTFVHWVVWNIPPDKMSLRKGETLSEPQGTTDFGKTGYGGPCPPSGVHRYFFKIYALDTMLDFEAGSTKADLEKAMQDHIIEKAELVGKYSRN